MRWWSKQKRVQEFDEDGDSGHEPKVRVVTVIVTMSLWVTTLRLRSRQIVQVIRVWRHEPVNNTIAVLHEAEVQDVREWRHYKRGGCNMFY